MEKGSAAPSVTAYSSCNEMNISCEDAMIQSFWFILRDKLELFLFE